MIDPSRRVSADVAPSDRAKTWAALGLGILLVVALLTWGGLRYLDGRPLPRARRAYERGDWREAATAVRALLRAEPDRTDALTLLARSEARLGRASFARSLYGRLDPARLGAEDYFLVARGLIAEGQAESGRKGLERALEFDPEHAEALRELARLGRRTDRLADAGYAAGRLAGRPGWEARGLVLLGRVRDERGDFPGAAGAYREALSRDPGLVGSEDGSPGDVRKWLVRDLLRVGRAGEARPELDRLLAGGADDPEVYWLMSRAALQAHDPATATAALARASGFGADRPETTEPAPYVGFESCADCHPAIVRAQRGSRHAQTFRDRTRLGDLPIPNGPRADPSGPEVVHTIARVGADVVFRVQSPEGDRRALVEFVMGSGDRAMTLVGRDPEGRWHELRMSYYGSIEDWDRTPGQRPRPEALHEFLGLPQSDDAIRRCLGCHTTWSQVDSGKATFAAEPGFSCERCHGPAGNHLEAVALKFPDPAIGRPRLATARGQVALCGQCHGAGGRGLVPEDPDLARFQATALPLSRCATSGREGTMSCLTCHDPHRNAENSPAFYEAKCLGCHIPKAETAGPRDAPSFGEPKKIACPVNPRAGCLDCHMPKIPTSVPNTTFTDHFIRVRPSSIAK